MSYALGIDIGTSGVRTAVIDKTGTPVSSARAPHVAQTSDDIDARLWWQAVETCLHAQVQSLHDAAIDPRQIASIAVDGTSGSMVLTDADLNPVSPALMYNSKGFDAEAQEIAKWAADPHITRGSNSALARAMRLFSRANAAPAHLLHQADFITAKLMGFGGLSDENNALKTGFDPERAAWPEWIGNVFPRHLLPHVKPVGSRLGTLDPAMAEGFGLNPETVVAAGTTDSIAAFVACAPFQRGIAVTSLGSTLAVKALSERRIDDPAIGLYSHKIAGFWLVGGASNTGGAVLAHFFSPDEIADLSKSIDPKQQTGLDYYPLLKPGERFPINDTNFQGRLDPRPDDDHHFLAGLFEGIAGVERLCYREIERRGGGFPNQIFTAGGGASNKVYAAIRSRSLGLDVQAADNDEASIGTARISTWAIKSPNQH
ncbi:MAG: FGGY-family carbohydrate kinase [Pseudomonadota bacterium]